MKEQNEQIYSKRDQEETDTQGTQGNVLKINIVRQRSFLLLQ